MVKTYYLKIIFGNASIKMLGKGKMREMEVVVIQI